VRDRRSCRAERFDDEQARAVLNLRQQGGVVVLRRRYWLGQTLAVIAADLGVTKQAVQQVEARAIKRLREIFAKDTA
jgi:DNA-directed RNA polymerase sigma subunit (sigma70/sigma32)